MMKLTSSGLTHVGMKRSHNEDCLRISRDENLFIVADGMGGHASGEVASEMSAETLVSFYQTSSLDENLTWPYRYDYSQSYEENRIRVGVQLSNHRIYSASTYDVKLKGMGTTIVAMSFYDQLCSIGHVGDSRVYLYRKGTLTQLTEDHSLLNDYIKMKPGGMTEEEIEAFPHKNVIVRALGMKSDVMVDVITQEVEEGDLYLLCSDGLSGMITDAQMADLIQKQLEEAQSLYNMDLDSLCVHLINAANENGGNDNVTALIVRCDSLKASSINANHSNSSSSLTPVWFQTEKGFQKADIQESVKSKSKKMELKKSIAQPKPTSNPIESSAKADHSTSSQRELPTLTTQEDIEDDHPTLQTAPYLDSNLDAELDTNSNTDLNDSHDLTLETKEKNQETDEQNTEEGVTSTPSTSPLDMSPSVNAPVLNSLDSHSSTEEFDLNPEELALTSDEGASINETSEDLEESSIQSYNETDEFHSYSPLPSLEPLEEESSDPTLNMKPLDFSINDDDDIEN